MRIALETEVVRSFGEGTQPKPYPVCAAIVALQSMHFRSPGDVRLSELDEVFHQTLFARSHCKATHSCEPAGHLKRLRRRHSG